MSFQLYCDESFAAVSGCVHTDEVHGPWREIAEDSAQYEGCMADVEGADLVADIDDVYCRIDGKDPGFNGCYVMVTFSSIG